MKTSPTCVTNFDYTDGSDNGREIAVIPPIQKQHDVYDKQPPQFKPNGHFDAGKMDDENINSLTRSDALPTTHFNNSNLNWKQPLSTSASDTSGSGLDGGIGGSGAHPGSVGESSNYTKTSHYTKTHKKVWRRKPCSCTCFSRTWHLPLLLVWCSCCEERSYEDEDDLDTLFEPEPFRKRCCRMCLTVTYTCLAAVAVVFTYSMVQDLITSMKNPVRSIHYKKMLNYNAPGQWKK